MNRIVGELKLGTPPGRLRAPEPKGWGALNFRNGSAQCLRTYGDQADRQGGTLLNVSLLRIGTGLGDNSECSPASDGNLGPTHRSVVWRDTPYRIDTRRYTWSCLFGRFIMVTTNYIVKRFQL
jgi:hypothetical protein